MTQAGSLKKWLSGPVAHIAAAIFLTAGMLAALSVRLLMHNQTIRNIVLWLESLQAIYPISSLEPSNS
jgi:hypothetical protein